MAQYSSSAIVAFGKLGYKPDELYQFKYADYIENLYGNALILQKSWAKRHPEATKGLVRAYVRGLIEARRSPVAAIDALLKREPLLNRQIEEADLELANKDYYFTKNVIAKGVGYQTAAEVDSFIKLLVAPLKLPRVPAASEVYTAEYIPDLKDRMVTQ